MTDEEAKLYIDNSIICHVKYVDDGYGGTIQVYHRIGDYSNINLITGYIEWHYNGFRYFKTRDYCERCGFDDETKMFWLLKYGEDLPTHENSL